MDRKPVEVSPYRKEPPQPVPWVWPAWLIALPWRLDRAFGVDWLPRLLFGVLVATMTVAAGGGCGAEQLASKTAIEAQARVADGIALAANSALPVLVDRYRQDGLIELQAVKDRGGSREDAEAAIQAVKDRWHPLWNAWASLAVAQNGWADVLEHGGDGARALAELRNAYCELLAEWPGEIPVVPLAPLSCPASKEPTP
jgi:hypothetical protein